MDIGNGNLLCLADWQLILHYGTASFCNVQGSVILKADAVCSSKTLPTYQTIWCHNPSSHQCKSSVCTLAVPFITGHLLHTDQRLIQATHMGPQRCHLSHTTQECSLLGMSAVADTPTDATSCPHSSWVQTRTCTQRCCSRQHSTTLMTGGRGKQLTIQRQVVNGKAALYWL